MKQYEEIPHTADWSFRAFGKDLRELFENAAFAIFALEGGTSRDLERDAQAREHANETARVVAVRAMDYESLLVNWLTELLWLQESHHETYQRFNIETLSPTALRAQVFGTPMTGLDKTIKAVTYHNLKIAQTARGWEAVVVVDV